MKKIAGLPALIFLSLVLFISPGCEKENETSYPAIKVSVSEHDIDYGGTVTISWVSNDEVKLNNESVNSSGSYTSVPLFETTNFLFTVSNSKGTAKQTETISVRAEVFAPTLNVILPDSIAWNQTETISYSSTGVAKLTINGQLAPVNGEYITEKALDQPVHIVFSAEGPKGNTTKEVTIPVRAKTRFDYITAFGPFKMSLSEAIFENGEWTEMNLGELASRYHYFYDYSSNHPNYTPYYFETYEFSGQLIGNGHWALVGDKLDWFGQIWDIQVLNENTLQLTGKLECVGTGCLEPFYPLRWTLTH